MDIKETKQILNFMETNKREFIKKWSSWWRTRNQHELLTEAFETELNAIIEQAVASKNLVKADVNGCVCTPEESSGWTTVKCCNQCGLPVEKFWCKH